MHEEAVLFTVDESSEEVHARQEAEREAMLVMYAHDPERQRQMRQAFTDDDRLMENMRAAGML